MTQKLSKDDHLIFWGGGNIYRTPTSKSLRRIFRYLQEKQHTSITVIVKKMTHQCHCHCHKQHTSVIVIKTANQCHCHCHKNSTPVSLLLS